jgi:hypothetical protein
MRNILVLAFALGACSPYSPDLGVAPFVCGDTDPKCPDGFECQAPMGSATGPMICVAPNGTVPDAHTDCANDSMLEPNDTTATAYDTGVAESKLSIPYAGLAICPAGDKDTYKVHITTEGQNLEVVITYDPNGAVLTGALLNAGGVPIAMASPVSGMEGVIRAYTANLPVGFFYAQVAGPTTGNLLTNNYKMTVTVSGP